tara:strand:- start:108 stop:722 length:615 start_codon:yes stop_codon:yes gene_type:complete
MTEYIQFPRYSISLTPSQSFLDDLNFFYEKNNLESYNLPQSIYGTHYSVKAPFYMSHLYSEIDLINHFNSINSIQTHNILKRSFKAIGLSEFKKNLILELESDQELNFFVHDLMRSFDRFRKILDSEGIKKDLLIFNQLSEKELMYYQIWGYPYYFECGKHHISIVNYDPNLKLINFNPISYVSLRLSKQESANESFKELAVLI